MIYFHGGFDTSMLVYRRVYLIISHLYPQVSLIIYQYINIYIYIYIISVYKYIYIYNVSQRIIPLCPMLYQLCLAKVTRLLPVLPALDAVAASLLVTVAASFAAAVREQKLSPQQGGRIAVNYVYGCI